MSLTNLGSQRPRDRADVVRRDRARAAGGRRRSPGLPEPVRPDRVRARASARCWRPAGRDPRDERPIWAAHVAAVEEASRRRHPVRDGSRPLPRPRPVGPLAGLGHRRTPALEHGRRGAGPDLQPPLPGQARARRDRARDLLHGRRRVTRARSSTSPTSTASRPPSSGRRPSPGRRPRSSSITSGSSRTRPTSSNAWPTGSSTRTRRCGRRRRCWPSNERGASGLWAYGISGDLPIVLVRIDEAEDLDIVRQLLRAHEYWRLKLLDVDLVILNEHGATYAQDLQDALETLVRTSQSIARPDGHPGHGGVYILRGDQLSDEDRTLLLAAARAVLLSRRGSLADQVIRLERPERIGRPPAAPARADCRRARPSSRARSWSSSTGSAASPTAGVSTSRSSAPDSRRRRRG